MGVAQSINSWAGPVDRAALVAIFVVYLFTAKGYIEVSDTTYSLQTAEAIVGRGRLDISPSPGGTMTTTDGLSYSKYGIGLPLAFIPLVALSRLLAGVARLPSHELAGFLISFLNVPFCLITLVLFGRLLRQWGASERYARLLTVGLALGTLCWRYAVSDFSEAMQAALLLLAVYGVVGESSRRMALGGLGLAGLVLVKLVYVVQLPVFLAYVMSRPDTLRRVRPRAIAVVAPVVLSLALVCWLNAIRFGNPLESGYGAEARQFQPGQLSFSVPRLLGSLDKGLLVFCPLLALGVAGWPAFFRGTPREASLCAGLVMVNLLLAGAWHSWEGGWSWGPRLLVPAIPLWLLPAGLLFRGNPSRRAFACLAGLVLISAVVQVPGVLVKDQQIHHIQENMLMDEERGAFPADWPAAWVILGHKLGRSAGESYAVAEFGLPGERVLDLGHYPTYQGLNVWSEHLARNFRKPMLRWLPLVGLAVALVLGLATRTSVARTVRA